VQGTACTEYCGWHDYFTYSGVQLVYSWVGILSCSGCTIKFRADQTSPSLDIPTHSMMSVLAHEVAEAASNPFLNAWYDSQGNENADKCAWTFGSLTSETVPGRGTIVYNMKGADGSKFYIQQNWDPSSGACSPGRPYDNGALPPPRPPPSSSSPPPPIIRRCCFLWFCYQC
jgi:hypothetical protein